MYLVIQSVISAIVLIIIYAHCFFCTCSFPLYTHTLIMVAFWRPWICTSRYWTVVLMCRYSMRRYALRGAWVLFLWFWYTYIFILVSYISPLTSVQLPFLFCYSLLSCVVLYVLLQWPLIIMLLIYSLIRLHLGLACIRGVFSLRIYVADSRRDPIPAYFGKRGVTGFSWYRSLGFRPAMLNFEFWYS